MKPSTILYHEDTVKQVLAIVERDLSADWELDGIASSIGTSRRSVQRAFAVVGKGTFRETLQRLRMERAAVLLTQDDNPTVKQVAKVVGYNQPAQFAKAFRTVMGATPSQFRESAPRPKRWAA